MAISEKIFEKFNYYVNKSNSILELGDQSFENECVRKFNLKYSIVKDFCEDLKKLHVSIDITGRNRSLIYDLNNEIIDINDVYDLVTNFGTTEHIEPNQYEPFKHIHNLCKIGGDMIHEVPVENNWVGHCKFYYNENFFETLAKENNYDINEMFRINYPNDGDLLFVSLKKQDYDFKINRKLLQSNLIISNISINIPQYWKS